jgi:methionine aminopeptidase
VTVYCRSINEVICHGIPDARYESSSILYNFVILLSRALNLR